MKFAIFRQWRGCVFGAFLAVLSSNAAAGLLTAKVIDSYGSCSWKNNGDGTSTIDLTINFKAAVGGKGGNLGTGEFYSRGILVYTYSAGGKMNPSEAAAKVVEMNGVKATSTWPGSDYVMYFKAPADGYIPEWHNTKAHSAKVTIVINNSVITDYPGVAVRAGNFTSHTDVGESTGGAYLSSMGPVSTCEVVNPEVPPPPPPAAIQINMAVPDWNLGELPPGDDTKELVGLANQLCFTYSGDDDYGKSYRNFVINATSENSVGGTRYLLKSAGKTRSIPYDLTLDSGSAKFQLPNMAGDDVRLDKGNRTCFTPTFRTSVGIGTEPGEYSDVLSFTIVTKS
ncbi:hypothetical protein [Burkholderia lata]|nr:hypothetical protein [Burkholderia lata]